MFDIISLQDYNIVFDVEESLDDLRWNAITKATTYSKLSWFITLSDDTWFFIEELWWLPWVAVRRWWWELKNEISDVEFLEFFKKKIFTLTNLDSYFEYEIAIALPNWDCTTINEKSYWKIDKNKLFEVEGHEWGYPLSKCFVHTLDWKTWCEYSDHEKQIRDQKIIWKIKQVLKKYLQDWILMK